MNQDTIKLPGLAEVPQAAIVYFQGASRRYSTVHCDDNQVAVASVALSEIERLVEGFLRIHKGLLVNRRHIVSARSFKNKGEITLSTGKVLPVSRRRRAEVWLALETPIPERPRPVRVAAPVIRTLETPHPLTGVIPRW